MFPVTASVLGKSSETRRSEHPNASDLLGLTLKKETLCAQHNLVTPDTGWNKSGTCHVPTVVLSKSQRQLLEFAWCRPQQMAHQPPQDKRRAAACFLHVIFAHTPSASELSTNLNAGSQGTFSRAVPASEQLAFSTTRCLQPPSPTPWEHKRCKEELFATEKFPDKEVAHGNMPHKCTPSPKGFAV